MQAHPHTRPPLATAQRLAAALLGALAIATAAAPATAQTASRTARAEARGPAGVLVGSGLPMDSFGVYVREVDDATPRALAALNEDRPYVLASTAKVVTSLAALDLLGPAWRWRTFAYTTGPIVDGRLQGDLLIVGGGNARLSTEDLRQWFAQMRAQGLDEIAGDLVLDTGAFRLQDSEFASTPPPAPDRPHHMRPEALTLDEGVLRIAVESGSRGPVVTLPPLSGVRLVNQVKGGAGCTAWARWGDGRDGTPEVVVRGQWQPRCGRGEIVQAPLSHGEHTSRALGALWREAGGRLLGRVVTRAGTGGLPGAQAQVTHDDGLRTMPWSVHRSAPLPELIREINKTSDNLAARNLMLSLAQGFPMQPATLASAHERVLGWLRQQGLADGDVQIDSGSGLSRAERAKPRALVQLLVNAWRSPQGQTFVDSLPIAGVDGTLQHRLRNGLAAGQAWLKTGTLNDARALAGYVRARSGRVYAVAALVNHPEAGRATRSLDALIEWIARHG